MAAVCVGGDRVRSQPFAPALGRCPLRQIGYGPWPLSVVQVHPHPLEVVQVAAEAKTSASSFEGLGLRRCACVLVISPLLASRRVRAKTTDTKLASNKDFDDGLLILAALKIGGGVHLILPGPASGGEQSVEPVGVGTLIRIRDHLAARFSFFALIRDPPVDHSGIEGELQSRAKIFDLLLGEPMVA